MGFGYWLDPTTQQANPVTRHELWVLDRDNARRAGIPQQVHDHLTGLDATRDQDEIRMAAIDAGMVRIRDHGNRISVQFAATPEQERFVLRAVYGFLREVSKDPHTDLCIDNFADHSSVKMSLDDLGRQVEGTAGT